MCVCVCALGWPPLRHLAAETLRCVCPSGETTSSDRPTPPPGDSRLSGWAASSAPSLPPTLQS
eukprot:7646002-Pyramimonas_sp.AAC.1